MRKLTVLVLALSVSAAWATTKPPVVTPPVVTPPGSTTTVDVTNSVANEANAAALAQQQQQQLQAQQQQAAADAQAAAAAQANGGLAVTGPVTATGAPATAITGPSTSSARTGDSSAVNGGVNIGGDKLTSLSFVAPPPVSTFVEAARSLCVVTNSEAWAVNALFVGGSRSVSKQEERLICHLDEQGRYQRSICNFKMSAYYDDLMAQVLVDGLNSQLPKGASKLPAIPASYDPAIHKNLSPSECRVFHAPPAPVIVAAPVAAVAPMSMEVNVNLEVAPVKARPDVRLAVAKHRREKRLAEADCSEGEKLMCVKK